jgi:hypothetical protein
MSDADIERIMDLANCSNEIAKDAFAKTGNIVDAVDMIIITPPSRGAPKIKIITESQRESIIRREVMEGIDRSIVNNIKSSNQPDSSSPELQHTLVLDQEELMLRSDCIQNSLIPVQEEVEQTQETACQ